jgi:hypothetical protein
VWDFAKHKYNQKKRRGVPVLTMSTLTTRKLKMNNCAHKELFKAVARIEAKLAKTSVTDKNWVAHPVKHITVMAEHYVPSESDNMNSTRLGNPQFRDWLPSDLGADARYWEKKGITGGRLLTGTYLNVHTGQNTGKFKPCLGCRLMSCLRPSRPIPELHLLSSITSTRDSI